MSTNTGINYLIKYQTELGLEPDGIIGPKTLQAITHDLHIPTLQCAAHILGQGRLESAGFTALRENLNYSAKGLATTWGRFSSTGAPGGDPNALALKLANRPVEIANLIYANRMGNGPAETGHGWKYRGGLVIQTTGKINWQDFMTYIGVPTSTDPTELQGRSDFPRLYFLGGLFFFERNSLFRYCISGSALAITKVGRAINLGNPKIGRAHV